MLKLSKRLLKYINIEKRSSINTLKKNCFACVHLELERMCEALSYKAPSH